MIWLLSNIRTIGFISAILVALSLGGYLGREYGERRLESALLSQRDALITSCNQDKKITEEAANDIETKNAALNKRLAELKRLPAKCVSVTSSGAVSAPAKVQPKPAGSDTGITSTALYEFAGECEKDRIQLNGLVEFVQKVWGR